jgi:hypothetical protein
MPRRIEIVVAALALSAGCATSPASRPDTIAQRAAAAPSGRFDLATARKLCENPDSAAAGLAGCRLRDQARVY